MIVRKKIWRAAAVTILLCMAVYLYLAQASYKPNHQQKLGVTFSQKFAEELGVDWRELYSALLDDLGVRYLRLASYWDHIEPTEGTYDFADLDWQVAEAEKRGASIIMTVGRRQPRWPECHDPLWLERLSADEARERELALITAVVTRYKGSDAVEIWQVENEPFLEFFGECRNKITKDQLQREIDLVRSLDDRPIMVTDSGELSAWYPAILMGDIFGSTVYKRTWNKYLGYWNYFFIGPSWYRVRALVFGRPLTTAFIAELQAEPWFPGDPKSTPIDEQFKTLSPEILRENIEFARKTNFERAYLWGVEWWYWMKGRGNEDFWEIMKTYFTNQTL